MDLAQPGWTGSSQPSRVTGPNQWPGLATVACMRESLTHACNSNRAINLIKQGKMKNLLLRLRLKARLREMVLTIDDSAYCSRRRRNFSRLRSRWTMASGARWGERVACWPDTLPCFFLSSLVLVACFLSLLCLLLNIKLNLDGQGRQPPAATDQPPATSCMPPAAFTPPSTAAFTLEGWIFLFWIRV